MCISGCTPRLTPHQIHQKYLAQNPKEAALENEKKKSYAQSKVAQQESVKPPQQAPKEPEPDKSPEEIDRIIAVDIFYAPYQQLGDGTPVTIFLMGKRNKECSSFGDKWYVAHIHDMEHKNKPDIFMCWSYSGFPLNTVLMNPKTGAIQQISGVGAIESAEHARSVFMDQEIKRQRAQFNRVLKANCGGVMNPCESDGYHLTNPSQH